MRSSNICRSGEKCLANRSAILLLALAFAAISQRGFALNPGRAMSQYVHRAWGPEQGYLSGTIYAIDRSSDGFLWIGTDRGLVRFDGNNFELIRRPLPNVPPNSRVRALVSDAQGTLWILLEGPYLLLYRDGQFSNAFSVLNIRETTVTAMSLDQKKFVLMSGFGNVFGRSQGGKFETIANADLIPGTVTSLAETMDGRIWMGTRDDGLFMSEKGRVSRVSYASGDSKINALAADFNGGLWVGNDQGIFFLTPQGELTDPLPKWTHQHQILAMFRDRDACVWAGTDKGLIRITPDGEAAFRPSAGGGSVNAVFQDHEFNLWFGGSGGLERLQDGVFSSYSWAEGFPSTAVGPIFADTSGGVWFGPLAGGLYWSHAGRIERIHLDGLDRDIIYSIDGVGGDVWVGRQSGGLTRIRDSGGRLTGQTLGEKQGLPKSSVYAVHVSPNGTVWAGTVSAGVIVFGGSIIKTYSTENGLSSNTVNSITESRDGHVWIATPNGIDEFGGSQWKTWTIKDGLPSSDIKLCFADSKNAIWVSTTEGLSYISDGRVHAMSDIPPPLREQILGIVEDQLGFIWFSTSDRMLRVNRSALLSGSLREGDFQSYGASDGLAAVESLRRERSLVSDGAGRIWVSLNHGVASAEPQLTDRDSAPVQVRIDSVSANGKAFAPGELSRMQSGTRSIIFHYSSDVLFAPERVRFRYRLEGADADWSDNVESRQVLYNNLGPGSYHLHVLASRDGSFWNGQETVYDFSIVPAYWQTWWFRTSAALLIALIALLVVRLRHLRLERQLSARFHERLAERTRIAQELHDTLLQSFQGLMLRFQTAVNLLPGRPSDAKNVLEEALDRADDALAESRNAIQNIRAPLSKSTNLSESINGLMVDLAREYANRSDHRPTYSVVVEGTPRPLKDLVGTEIFRIAQECVRNAFQHAQPNLIDVLIRFEDARFQMRLRDDGVGIDPEILMKGSRAGHWGLTGMKERAAQIGAKLELWSKPGAGTEMELSVPGHIAYDRSQAKLGSQPPQKGLS